MIRHDDEDDEADATEEAEQAEPLGMALALGVVHATPDEKDDADDDEEQPDDGERRHECDQDASENFEDDAEAYADVGIGLVLCQHGFVLVGVGSGRGVGARGMRTWKTAPPPCFGGRQPGLRPGCIGHREFLG